MTILTALQSAAIRLVGERPSVFFGSSEQMHIELCDLINEVANDIVDFADWQGLTKLAQINGDGTTTEFALPPDYSRQLLHADIQDTNSWLWGYCRVTDINDFTYWRDRGFTGFPGCWIIYQNQIHFSPAPSDGTTATYPYISNQYAVSGDTLEPKAQFDADTDTFKLNERLLTLGLVWRWREMKKMDFSGDQEAFMLALSESAAKDKGSRIYRSGRRTPMRGTYLAWPWQLGPA